MAETSGGLGPKCCDDRLTTSGVGQAWLDPFRHGITTVVQMPETAFWWTLAGIFLVARFAYARSEWRQAKGLCARCGRAPGNVALGWDRFCEPCSERAQRGQKAASQFVGFLGILTLIPVVLTGFLAEMDSSLRLRFLAVLMGIGVFFLWIHRSMVRKAAK